MISLSKIKNSGAASRYFEGGDYYAKDDGGNATMGEWSGEAAKHLNLDSNVSIPQFKSLLDGKLPNGDSLGKATGSDEAKAHTKGWDITFSAPKSVSIMALVAGDKRLIEAHESAVKTALGYMEKNFVTTRVSDNGESKHEKTGNAAFASFTHSTSRSLDPQLHTHNVMLNATLSNDGKWRSIDSRVIYNNSMAVSSIYKMELASLVKELGYETEKGKHGNIEIKGVSKDLMDEFSQRRDQILKAKDEHGYSTAKGMDKAAVRTRDAKKRVTEKELSENWSKTAATEMVQLKELISSSLQQPQPNVPQGKQHKSVNDALKSAIANLSERNAVFGQTQLLSETHRWLEGTAKIKDIEGAISKAVKDGKLLAGEFKNSPGYTTKEQLKLEKTLIQSLGKGVGKADELAPVWVADLKAKEHKLNDGQTSALRTLATSRDLFVGIQGYAGVGKTHMLNAYRELAEDQGRKLHGFAPTNNAAKILAKESSIQTDTSAKLVWNIKNNKTDEYKGISTLVLDESSLMGSKDMKVIADFALTKKIQVVMLGDRHQLNGVAAGKPFEQSTSSGLDTAVMSEIMRQKDSPNLLASINAIVGNQPSKAFRYLDDKIIELPKREERLESIVSKYIGLTPEERENHLLLIPDNQTRREVNDLIQQRLIDRKEIDGEKSVEITSLQNKQLTDKEKSTAKFYSVGDHVSFSLTSDSVKLKANEMYEVVGKDKASLVLQSHEGTTHRWNPDDNKKHTSSAEAYESKRILIHEGEAIRSTKTNKEENIKNGANAIVEKIDRETSTVTMRENDGSQHKMPLNKAANWDLAYSSTVYVSQGATVKDVTMHLESHRVNLTNLKTAYVGLTRSKGNVDIVVDSKQRIVDALTERSGERTSAMELTGNNPNKEFEEGMKPLNQKIKEKVRQYFGVDKPTPERNIENKSIESMELER